MTIGMAVKRSGPRSAFGDVGPPQESATAADAVNTNAATHRVATSPC